MRRAVRPSTTRAESATGGNAGPLGAAERGRRELAPGRRTGCWHHERVTFAEHYDRLLSLRNDPNADDWDFYAAASLAISDGFQEMAPADAFGTVFSALRAAGHAGVSAAWLALGRVFGDLDEFDPAVDACRKADRAGSVAGAGRWIELVYRRGEAKYERDAATRLVELMHQSPEDPRWLRLWGCFLVKGYGVPADPATAAGYLRASAERGDADAAFELANLYARGSGVPADRAAADGWMLRAAELGDREAMGIIGDMYATGTRVAQDAPTALSWYDRAADAGHGEAAFNAGVMCRFGLYRASVDPDRAQGFFDRARANGFDVDGKLGDLRRLL